MCGSSGARSSPTSYWFLIPLGARFVRIGLMVMGAASLFDIHGTEALMKFYDDGFGPLAAMPLWLQAFTFVAASDFLLYWFHRLYHGAALWKYHAVHHSSEELDWISAARFHPVNILFGTVIVDVALLLAGISPNGGVQRGQPRDLQLRARMRAPYHARRRGRLFQRRARRNRRP